MGRLLSVEWWINIDVFGKHVGPVFEEQSLDVGTKGFPESW